jgi:hypothetical protein
MTGCSVRDDVHDAGATEYQLWIQSEDGAPSERVLLDCTNVVEAAAQAERYLTRARAVEIWRWGRLVTVVRAAPGKSRS